MTKNNNNTISQNDFLYGYFILTDKLNIQL